MKVLIAALLAAAPVAGLAGQTAPAGGAPSIFDKAVNQPGIGWSVYGADQTARQVPAADVPGGGAVRVTVARAGAHAYDVGGIYPTTKPIAAGDTMFLMVFLRAPNAKGDATVPVPIGATEADAPYTQISAETVQVGAAWKRFYAVGVSPKAFAAGKARITVQLAGAKQVLELGPAFLLDLGPKFDTATLPHN